MYTYNLIERVLVHIHCTYVFVFIVKQDCSFAAGENIFDQDTIGSTMVVCVCVCVCVHWSVFVSGNACVVVYMCVSVCAPVPLFLSVFVSRFVSWVYIHTNMYIYTYKYVLYTYKYVYINPRHKSRHKFGFKSVSQICISNLKSVSQICTNL